MTHAIVLIQSDRSSLATLGGELADVDGVAEAYSVTGDWDFVAVLRLRQPDDLARVVTGKIAYKKAELPNPNTQAPKKLQ